MDGDPLDRMDINSQCQKEKEFVRIKAQQESGKNDEEEVDGVTSCGLQYRHFIFSDWLEET